MKHENNITFKYQMNKYALSNSANNPLMQMNRHASSSSTNNPMQMCGLISGGTPSKSSLVVSS